jgi:hypothetical protein
MSSSAFMIDTDSVLYGRRLVREIRKQSHNRVFVDSPIGRYQVYYAEFTGDSIQLRTMCKWTLHLEPNEWAKAFYDQRGREIAPDRRLKDQY